MTWRKFLEKKSIFLLHLNEFNLKDDFENYTVVKIFLCTFKWQKGIEKRKIHNPICYINPFATLFLNLQKKYKNIYKKNCHIIEI